jgi:hypothetical protein
MDVDYGDDDYLAPLPPPRSSAMLHHGDGFATMRSVDDASDRRQRRHRRLRRARSSTSSLSRRGYDDENFDPIFHLRRQPGTVVYAYSFEGDHIDRRPLPSPLASRLSASQPHARSAADIIHGFHHPAFPNGDVEDLQSGRHRDDRASLLRRRHRLLRHRPRPESDSMVVEFHRSPPHNSLSSSPQGEATTTASGSVSPDVSPIVNIGESVTRLTTSPATPPSFRQCEEDSVIHRAVMTSSRIATRSAIRRTSTLTSVAAKKPAKSVQWFCDLKKRAEDISDDRKVVKSQVDCTLRPLRRTLYHEIWENNFKTF